MRCSIILLAITTAGGCAMDAGTTQYDNSAIAVCGGGLSSGVSAKIEAEYDKLKGGVDAGFVRYVKAVLDANGATQEKYDAYIKCVLEIDKRQRSERVYNLCIDRCDANSGSCERTITTAFNACIEDQMDGCLRDCRRRGFSRDECYAELCSWSDLDKKAKAYYTGICERSAHYRTQVSLCIDEAKTCRDSCSTDDASPMLYLENHEILSNFFR